MELTGLILDAVILAFLGATIFYANRLSSSIKAFRDGRAEFERVLKELDKSIIDAQDAISRLQQTSDDTGHQLQVKINESKALSDELQLVNEAAVNLADRIEALATRNRKIADKIENAVEHSGDPLDLVPSPSQNIPSPRQMRSGPTGHSSQDTAQFFEIRDRDAQSSSYDSNPYNEESDDIYSQDHALMSKAEIELAKALKK